MKSSFSNSQGNCVDVTIRPYADEEYVVVTDTEHKTGKGTHLLFRKDEWDAFVLGIQDGQLTWDALQAARDMADTQRRIAGRKVAPDPQRRTPENLAYINGRYAERNGWVPYDFERYCRRFALHTDNPKAKAMYDAFQSGRRAEAHEKAISEGH